MLRPKEDCDHHIKTGGLKGRQSSCYLHLRLTAMRREGSVVGDIQRVVLCYGGPGMLTLGLASELHDAVSRKHKAESSRDNWDVGVHVDVGGLHVRS